MAAQISFSDSDDVATMRADGQVIRDLALPGIDRDTCDAVNAWMHARGPAQFELDGLEYALSWQEPSFAQMHIALELALRSEAILIALDGLAAVDPLLVGAPFSLMPEALRTLVIQRALARFLPLLPPGAAESADVTRIHWDNAAIPRWECSLGFRLRRMPERVESHGILAVASVGTLRALHERMPISATQREMSRARLPVALPIELGRTCIDVTQLRELAAGDVVWIETARPSRRGLIAELRTHGIAKRFTCRIKQGSLHIVTAHAADAVVPSAAARSPNVSADSATPAATAKQATTAKLEIPVAFDMGELNVTIGELERLQPGKVFELPHEIAGEAVCLRVSGKAIAYGRLVSVGKRIGVRLSRVQLEYDSIDP